MIDYIGFNICNGLISARKTYYLVEQTEDVMLRLPPAAQDISSLRGLRIFSLATDLMQDSNFLKLDFKVDRAHQISDILRKISTKVSFIDLEFHDAIKQIVWKKGHPIIGAKVADNNVKEISFYYNMMPDIRQRRLSDIAHLVPDNRKDECEHFWIYLLNNGFWLQMLSGVWRKDGRLLKIYFETNRTDANINILTSYRDVEGNAPFAEVVKYSEYHQVPLSFLAIVINPETYQLRYNVYFKPEVKVDE